MDLNSKINYFLKNAPSDSVQKLNGILNEVNLFVKDVTIERFEMATVGNTGFPNPSTKSNKKHAIGKKCVVDNNDKKVSGDGSDRNGVKHKNKNNNDVQLEISDNCSTWNLKADEKKKINQIVPADADDMMEANDGSDTDLESIESMYGDNEASDSEKLLKLKEPLKNGWRRETVVSRISRNSQIQGTVRYYAPGSQVELTDIGQIQSILEKQKLNLGVENFTFSCRPIVGMFLQPFSSSCDAKYFYMSDVAMSKRLEQHKDLRMRFEKRQKKRTSCAKTDDKNEQSAADSDDITPNNSSETFTSTSEVEIKLFKIDESTNYYDERGFLYSKNNSKQIQNSYFRCKNSKRYHCHARAKATGNNLEKSILTREHNHLPHDGKVDKEKFDKQLIKACEESPYSYPRELYAKTRKLMKSKVNPMNIPLKGKYDTLIQRKRRKYIPKLPKSVEEFEQLIQNYKEQYFYDERDLPFYRNVWKTKAGEKNIVFISESVLKQLERMRKDNKDIHMLMDGTFKVLPHHIKFRQLYIISVIYEGRCYPLAYILMEKKSMYSYNVIFSKLKLLMGKCEITNFMSDYEAATRKALKIHFPRARISGCYFHYVKAINKSARRFGLSKETKFESAIQKISALALLPNEFISKGFRVIDHENRTLKHSLRWQRFKKYWKRQWSKANISVYGLQHRTNNFAESMNKSLNLLAKVKGPNIWILIEHLKTLEMDKTDELEKHVKGEIFTIDKTDEMNRLNDKIVKATKMFNKGQDVAKFLRNITCDERLENFFKERIYLDGIDEYDSEEDSGFDDDEEEDFISNDFDAVSNFFLQPKAGKIKRKAEEEKNLSKKRRVEYV